MFNEYNACVDIYIHKGVFLYYVCMTQNETSYKSVTTPLFDCNIQIRKQWDFSLP